ncbi:uncharacterized protein LOC132792450 [Drosophila nasuta]|uniref:uncharacterized protein LOC132792450 n=1 Tax=Drosophila nasuta TaxID=42062 RepID=UPI00295E5D49|nr:uncharacterized protein LOC132792450 [Drosophila nasuta]
MESINFNDFTIEERHEIIKAFLIKMRTANSMQSAQRFFEYYLKRFYKLPSNIIDDIIYCQRAMKTYLSVHQRITNFYANNSMIDEATKKSRLVEIEDILYELNAECQYLVICLEENIGHFCLPFTEQEMQPNVDLISEMVSDAVVPHVCASLSLSKPHFVSERPTESQLLRKYFSTETKTSLNGKDESPKPTRMVAPNKKPSSTVAAIAATPKPTAPPRPTVNRTLSPLLEVAIKNEAVNVSRFNLQQALKRARLNQQGAGSAGGAAGAGGAGGAGGKPPACETKMNNSQELFLQGFGLCTQSEYKTMKLSQAHRQKRKQKLVHK